MLGGKGCNQKYGGSTDVVEEFAELGGPSDLHDARRDGDGLVVPDAAVDLEGAADALEGRGVAARLQARRRDLQVLADVVAVEHHVDAGRVGPLVRVRPTLADDCNRDVVRHRPRPSRPCIDRVLGSSSTVAQLLTVSWPATVCDGSVGFGLKKRSQSRRLTEVVETPFGAEADLALDAVVRCPPLFQFQQRIVRLLAQPPVHRHLVLACEESAQDQSNPTLLIL